VAAAAAAVGLPIAALAAEKDWKSTVGSGNWLTAANWVPGVPISGDDVYADS
jgi:hypothetical protein